MHNFRSPSSKSGVVISVCILSRCSRHSPSSKEKSDRNLPAFCPPPSISVFFFLCKESRDVESAVGTSPMTGFLFMSRLHVSMRFPISQMRSLCPLGDPHHSEAADREPQKASQSNVDAPSGPIRRFQGEGIGQRGRQEQNAPERQKKTAIHRLRFALQKTLQTVATNRRFVVLVSA